MFKATGDSFYLEIVCPDGDIKFFVFERDYFWKSYFWKKHALMLTCNFDFQDCQKFVPSKIPAYAPEAHAKIYIFKIYDKI